MTPTTYGDILAKNIRAMRNRVGRAGIEQETVSVRMRSLGFSEWTRQTVSRVERGSRRVTAEEVCALAYALETTISRLLVPLDEDKAIEFRAGAPSIPLASFQLSAIGQLLHGGFGWDGDKPVFPEYPEVVANVASLKARGEWPPRSGG